MRRVWQVPTRRVSAERGGSERPQWRHPTVGDCAFREAKANALPFVPPTYVRVCLPGPLELVGLLLGVMILARTLQVIATSRSVIGPLISQQATRTSDKQGRVG